MVLTKPYTEYSNPISAERLTEDVFNEIDSADDLFQDENSMDMTRLLDNLREEIKFDENIAMKSAMLLKLLEVSVFQRFLNAIMMCVWWVFRDVLY